MIKDKEVKGNVKVFNKAIDFDNLPEVDLISKFIVHDATDEIIIGGFGNLEGNLGLLKYNFEEIRKMIKENNNDNDNIRLINSLLGSLKELHNENQQLKEQLQNISNEFLKYDWQTSNKEQIVNQLKKLYNSIFRGDK